MTDMTRAQATQTTRNGTPENWVVTLDGEELYTLPSTFTVQDTFTVRNIIDKMMNKAAWGAKEQAEELGLMEIRQVIANGDAQLDALKRENIRLSQILENHLDSEAK